MTSLNAEEVAQVVDGLQVVRIGHGDGEDLVLEGQRQHLVDGRPSVSETSVTRLGVRLDLVEVDDLAGRTARPGPAAAGPR